MGGLSDVVFAAATAAGPINTTLDVNYAVNSLTLSSTAAVSISGPQTLAINAAASGAGGLGYAAGTGVVMQAGAGSLAISGGTVTPAANQSWTNNSSSLLSVSSNVTGMATAGTTTLTLAGTGNGGKRFPARSATARTPAAWRWRSMRPTPSRRSPAPVPTRAAPCVRPGTLVAANDAALGTAGSVALTPTSGTTLLDFTSAAPAIGSLANSGAGTAKVVLGSTANGGSPTILTIGGNNASTTFSGTIGDLSGTNSAAIGSLVMTGTGTLTLSAANSYTGGTTLSGGTISAGNSSALGSGPITFAGGGLVMNSHNFANPIVIAAGTTSTVDGSATFTGNLTGAGTINKTATTLSLTLTGSNSGFSGTFIANGWRTFLYGSNAGSPNAIWQVNAMLGAGNNATFNGTVQLGGLTGTGTVAPATITTAAW